MKKNRFLLALFLTLTLGFVLAGIAQQATEETALDPVCGMTVKKSEARATFDYKGATYYFCNVGCKEAFAKDPEKYLQKKEGAEAAQPGTCPRCGRQMPMAGMRHGQMAGLRPGQMAGMGHGQMAGTCPMMGMGRGQGPMAGSGAAMNCPFMSKDVEIKTENLPDGAAVKLTSKDPETVKKIQEHLKNMKGGLCACCRQAEPEVKK
jgi:YHS domain-containing protein